MSSTESIIVSIYFIRIYYLLFGILIFSIPKYLIIILVVTPYTCFNLSSKISKVLTQHFLQEFKISSTYTNKIIITILQPKLFFDFVDLLFLSQKKEI